MGRCGGVRYSPRWGTDTGTCLGDTGISILSLLLVWPFLLLVVGCLLWWLVWGWCCGCGCVFGVVLVGGCLGAVVLGWGCFVLWVGGFVGLVVAFGLFTGFPLPLLAFLLHPALLDPLSLVLAPICSPNSWAAFWLLPS